MIPRNLYWFLSSKKLFVHLYCVKEIDNTSGNRPKLGILWGFSNIAMKERGGGPYLWLNKIWIQPSTGQKRKNMIYAI